MLYVDGLVGLILLVVWIYALFDVITTREPGIRNLPKWAWVLMVLLLGPEVFCAGAVLWFVAGRPRGPARSVAYKGNTGEPPTPGRSERAGRSLPGNPDDDADFLASLRARAEEQRRQAEAERRRQNGHDPT